MGDVRPGDQLAPAALGRLLDAEAALARGGVGGGVGVQSSGQGLVVKGLPSSPRFCEPALSCLACNVDSVDLEMYGAAELVAPLNVDTLEWERVITIRRPTSEYKWLPWGTPWGICAEPIPVGRVGKIYVAGLCLAVLGAALDPGGWLAHVVVGEQYLRLDNRGDAQVIWQAGGDYPQKALIRFSNFITGYGLGEGE